MYVGLMDFSSMLVGPVHRKYLRGTNERTDKRTNQRLKEWKTLDKRSVQLSTANGRTAVNLENQPPEVGGSKNGKLLKRKKVDRDGG